MKTEHHWIPLELKNLLIIHSFFTHTRTNEKFHFLYSYILTNTSSSLLSVVSTLFGIDLVKPEQYTFGIFTLVFSNTLFGLKLYFS